jgi:hypothetical protein
MNAMRLAERYLDTWNEADAEARRSAVAAIWTDDARYVDPLADVAGHGQISDLIGAVQAQAPGHVFRLLEGVDAHHNVMRFGWELVPESGGEPVAIGFDVAVTGADGRLEGVVGFLDRAPGA